MDAEKQLVVKQIKGQILEELDRKVDKVDFREFLVNKVSKKEQEMTMMHID